MNQTDSEFLIGSVRTTQLGEVWVAFSSRGLVTVEYGVRRRTFEATLRKQMRRHIYCTLALHHPGIAKAARQIAEYLRGERRAFAVAIDWSVLASDFQRLALRAVMAVPYGQVRTYGQVASQIGHPKASRAVGRANATNPMPLVIPCHRLIGSDGELHGYGGRGGLKTKQWLLDLERRHA